MNEIHDSKLDTDEEVSECTSLLMEASSSIANLQTVYSENSLSSLQQNSKKYAKNGGVRGSGRRKGGEQGTGRSGSVVSDALHSRDFSGSLTSLASRKKTSLVRKMKKKLGSFSSLHRMSDEDVDVEGNNDPWEEVDSTPGSLPKMSMRTLAGTVEEGVEQFVEVEEATAVLVKQKKQEEEQADELVAKLGQVFNEKAFLQNPYTNAYTEGLEREDYQVALTILEARLTARDVKPMVMLKVGKHKKHTSTKHSSTPEWQEVVNARKLHTPKIIGQFIIDVATVYSQPAHQFTHKWAVLLDPKDVLSGPKGYLKCNIAVSGSKEVSKAVPRLEKGEDSDEENIEANLLLPRGRGTGSERRQQALYRVKVYGGDGFHAGRTGVYELFRRAVATDSFTTDHLQIYAKVSFAGHKMKTTKIGCNENGTATWNEQLIFVETFPPLVRRLRIQIFQKYPVRTHLIATHFLDLTAISDRGPTGFLPTFGPSYVYLYGSDGSTGSALYDESSSLNTGVGEGVNFKGRLLLGLDVEVLSDLSRLSAGVFKEPTIPYNQIACSPEVEFLLFGFIMNVNMLPRKLHGSKVRLEVTMGKDRNVQSESERAEGEEEDEEEVELSEMEQADLSQRPENKRNKTPKLKAKHDMRKSYCYLPFGDGKPCVAVLGKFHDLRWRLFHVNYLNKMARSLEECMEDVESVLELGENAAEAKLQDTIETFAMECIKYRSYLKQNIMVGRSGVTQLDQERWKMCLKDVEGTESKARALGTSNEDISEKVEALKKYVNTLRELAMEPQDALPDILIWLCQGKKRIAYHRIRAQDLIHSNNPYECGRQSSKLHSYYLKLPGRLSPGEYLWRLQGHVSACFWLGISGERSGILDGIPIGFKLTQRVSNVLKANSHSLPGVLEYPQRSCYELRCHFYQARKLIASDDSGFSDPFARVLFCGRSDSTRTLVIKEIYLYGVGSEKLQKNPPTMILEFFDKDRYGGNDFVGQALVKPVLKLAREPYAYPRFPPTLQWHPIYKGTEPAGRILGIWELLQLDEDSKLSADVPPLGEKLQADTGEYIPVPRGIRPAFRKHRMEMFLWGLRDLTKVTMFQVNSPRIVIKCVDKTVETESLPNSKGNVNFLQTVQGFDIDLPVDRKYWPAIEVLCWDNGIFGKDTLVGCRGLNAARCFVKSVRTKNVSVDMETTNSRGSMTRQVTIAGIEKSQFSTNSQTMKSQAGEQSKDENLAAYQELVVLDWWSKFYASLDEAVKTDYKTLAIFKADVGTDSTASMAAKPVAKPAIKQDMYPAPAAGKSAKSTAAESLKKKRKNLKASIRIQKYFHAMEKPNVIRMKVYPTELEEVPEFEEFQDWVKTVGIYRGKETSRLVQQEDRQSGKIKGLIKICPYPADQSVPMEFRQGFFAENIPRNEATELLVRVYVIKAYELHPIDRTGRADPYLILKVGNEIKFNDRDNYAPNELNPTFGKIFEYRAILPHDYNLTIQVKDYDMLTEDDNIGETTIDLENRWYSKHRASCGISAKYETANYNSWRDQQKPSKILETLCQKHNLGLPQYAHPMVHIGNKTIDTSLPTTNPCLEPSEAGDRESLAVHVLHRWQEVVPDCPLVPEHVETRTLKSRHHPGLSMGKLVMWVDMFRTDSKSPPAPVHIAPRSPKKYELRVVVHNTEEVVLDDSAFFSGEKMSDIYIKGWLVHKHHSQKTDIHYRSLTGEGNFNWRFIFPFEYLEAEDKIVYERHKSPLSLEKTTIKILPILELQLWDADFVMADDFLGSLLLHLTRFPRGSKSPDKCSVNITESDMDAPLVNLFLQRRIKGWWPFTNTLPNGTSVLSGKVELEFELLTQEEAEHDPAGRGRKEPNALEKPNRPATSFNWLKSPAKSLKYLIWKKNKCRIMKCCGMFFGILILVVFAFTLPATLARKAVGR